MRFMHQALESGEDFRMLVREVTAFAKIIFQIIKLNGLKGTVPLITARLHDFPITLPQGS